MKRSASYPDPYLLVAIRERRKAAFARAIHYSAYQSACAKADAKEAVEDVEFYTLILEALDPKERRAVA